jgi:hypothetical protein
MATRTGFFMRLTSRGHGRSLFIILKFSEQAKSAGVKLCFQWFKEALANQVF